MVLMGGDEYNRRRKREENGKVVKSSK